MSEQPLNEAVCDAREKEGRRENVAGCMSEYDLNYVISKSFGGFVAPSFSLCFRRRKMSPICRVVLFKSIYGHLCWLLVLFFICIDVNFR